MYRVVPGDCLWSIAARVLGSSASSSATDRGWRAIYAANRAAIGENPNLIYPGLLLTLPPLTAAS
jgi:nucleoid-associated protein YgaU